MPVEIICQYYLGNPKPSKSNVFFCKAKKLPPLCSFCKTGHLRGECTLLCSSSRYAGASYWWAHLSFHFVLEDNKFVQCVFKVRRIFILWKSATILFIIVDILVWILTWCRIWCYVLNLKLINPHNFSLTKPSTKHSMILRLMPFASSWMGRYWANIYMELRPPTEHSSSWA